MKTINFPYIAIFLTSALLLVIIFGSQPNGQDATSLPLLTLLVVSEFSFIVTAIGAYIGIKQTIKTGFKLVYSIATLLCIILSIRFLLFGIALWPL